MAVRDAMRDRLDGHEFWINVILALPDMPAEDPEIKEYAGDRKVAVIWGLDQIGEQLRRIVDDQPDRDPPDKLDILAESAALDRREPPTGWLSRKAAPASSDNPTASVEALSFSGGPTLSPGGDAPVSVMYSFVINNHGNVYIGVPDAAMLTAQAGDPEEETVQDDALPTMVPDASADDIVCGGDDIDASSVRPPDPFATDVVADGFDDDPFA